MGWKTFKEHFNIEHKVHIDGNKLLIGSDYVQDLAWIDLNTFEANCNSTFSNFLGEHYSNLLTSSTEAIKELIQREDTFEKSLPIFYYDWENKNIVTDDFTEAYGYPNVTHKGDLIHDNTHYKDIKELVNYVMKEINYSISSIKEETDRLRKKIETNDEWVKKYNEDYNALANFKKLKCNI
jgi:hypothetical protein